MNLSRKFPLTPHITNGLTPCSSFARKWLILLKAKEILRAVRLSPLLSTSAWFAPPPLVASPHPPPLSRKGRGGHNPTAFLVRLHCTASRWLRRSRSPTPLSRGGIISYGLTRSASRWLRRATVAGLRAPPVSGLQSVWRRPTLASRPSSRRSRWRPRRPLPSYGCPFTGPSSNWASACFWSVCGCFLS